MIENENAIYKQIIEKIFNQYQIKFIPKNNIINITIYKINSDKIFGSDFTLSYLHSFKFLISCNTIENIIQFICGLIEKNNIKIEENNSILSLILISSLTNHPNVELILNEKTLISKETFEDLINEMNNLKNENKNLKEYFKDEINKLNDKIELIEKNKEVEINKLHLKLELNKIENKNIKDEITKINEKIEKKDKRFRILENEIKILEKFHINEIINLHYISSFKTHDDQIKHIAIFPLGNIISVSKDKSIKIYNNNFQILQDIQNAHNDWINYVDIKDENNFITCSKDKQIKTWIKKDNNFQINQIIENSHNDIIYKVIYISNNKIISCSKDKTIKIWEEDNYNIYKNIKILTHSNYIYSLLLLEDKNMFISGGKDGIKFWDLNNYELIIDFNESWCGGKNSLCRIDEDKIIVNGNDHKSLLIISISEKKIIKNINHSFKCWGITLIKEKRIFLIGGKSKDIEIYNNDEYKCIQIIKDAHDEEISGFCELKDGKIISYGNDTIVKIWSFDK